MEEENPELEEQRLKLMEQNDNKDPTTLLLYEHNSIRVIQKLESENKEFTLK